MPAFRSACTEACARAARGETPEAALIDEVSRGVYEVADFTRRDYAEIELMLATHLRSSASSADRRKIIIRR